MTTKAITPPVVPNYDIQLTKVVDDVSGNVTRIVVAVDFESRTVDTLKFDDVLENFLNLVENTDWEHAADALTMKVMGQLIVQSMGKAAIGNE
jgi:hypothetical protein